MSDIIAPRANQPPAINAYGELCAEVYVLDKPPGALGDSGYYRDALQSIEGPILESAVGSGRLLIPLLEAGLDVQGYDRSESMLERCRQAAAERGLKARLKRMSHDDFTYEERFGAIVIAVGSFTLVDDFAEALALLRRYYDHLRPGGRLFIDLMPLSYLANIRDSLRRWTTLDGDLLQLDSRRVELSWRDQHVVTHCRYERWRAARLVEQELEIYSLRCWGLKELELALREAGCDNISVCGDYQPGRPPGDSGYWCFQARRPA